MNEENIEPKIYYLIVDANDKVVEEYNTLNTARVMLENKEWEINSSVIKKYKLPLYKTTDEPLFPEE